MINRGIYFVEWAPLYPSTAWGNINWYLLGHNYNVTWDMTQKTKYLRTQRKGKNDDKGDNGWRNIPLDLAVERVPWIWRNVGSATWVWPSWLPRAAILPSEAAGGRHVQDIAGWAATQVCWGRAGLLIWRLVIWAGLSVLCVGFVRGEWPEICLGVLPD